jgi:DNA modification methylase
MTNMLYFGDNLDVLRAHTKDASVDLVYLDPPFKSDATYNVLFKDRTGRPSESQAEAFRDTWTWGEMARDAYDDVMGTNGEVALAVSGLRKWLGENAMMAYLAMMATRLIELRRIMKPNASLYLHCDPMASHYLKIILDATFSHQNFRNEIIWKRTSSHSGANKYAPVHDVLLYFGKSNDFIWNSPRTEYTKEYLDKYYKFDDGDGRLHWRDNLCAAGTRRGDSGRPWRGIDPTEKGMHWKFTVQHLEELDSDGRIYWPPRGVMPQYKRYRDELKGRPVTDIWDDIDRINPVGSERLGYPTQKPLQLLERIISASSNPGDTILDPFCGCGTTVEAAEKLGRQWVGIDVTHYAVTLIEKRLARFGAKYEVEGRPTDLAGARDLFRRDPHQFQWWAAWRLGAQSYREAKRGADRGIDGNIFFPNGPYGTGRIIISVKGGENIGPQFVRDLRGTIEREEAAMGIFVSLAEPTKAMTGEAAASGFVTRSAHGRLPRVQIVTIADIMDGRFPTLPPIPPPQRDAPPRRKKPSRQMELLLPIQGELVRPAKGEFVDPRFMEIS